MITELQLMYMRKKVSLAGMSMEIMLQKIIMESTGNTGLSKIGVYLSLKMMDGSGGL